MGVAVAAGRRRRPGSVEGSAPHQKWYAHGWNQDLSWKLILGIVPRIPVFLRPPVHLLTSAVCFAAMKTERRAAARNLRAVRAAGPASGVAASFRLFYNFSKFMTAYVDLPPYGRGLADRRLRGRELGRDLVHGLLDRGRGLIVLGAHVGQWDVALVELARVGVPIHVVMRREDEESARFAAAAREAAGLRTVYAGENPWMMVSLLAALRRNEIVAVQGDRLFGGRPLRASIFGKPTEIPRGPLDLAAASGAPILPAAAVFEGHRAYRLVFGHLIEAPSSAGDARGEAGGEGGQRIASGIERLVARYPEQWFNFYDVWGNAAPGGLEEPADSAGGKEEMRRA